MINSQQDISIWLKHPVTEEVFSLLKKLVGEYIDIIASGELAGLENDRFLKEYICNIGIIRALKAVLNVRFDDQQKKVLIEGI